MGGVFPPRALAMRRWDRWVAQGCDLTSPVIGEERTALVRSYAALLAVVHHLEPGAASSGPDSPPAL